MKNNPSKNKTGVSKVEKLKSVTRMLDRNIQHYQVGKNHESIFCARLTFRQTDRQPAGRPGYPSKFLFRDKLDKAESKLLSSLLFSLSLSVWLTRSPGLQYLVLPVNGSLSICFPSHRHLLLCIKTGRKVFAVVVVVATFSPQVLFFLTDECYTILYYNCCCCNNFLYPSTTLSQVVLNWTTSQLASQLATRASWAGCDETNGYQKLVIAPESASYVKNPSIRATSNLACLVVVLLMLGTRMYSL